MSGRASHSTSAAHSAPVGRCVPLVTLGLLAIFFQKTSRGPIATKAKVFTAVGRSVLCEVQFFMAALLRCLKFFDCVEVPAGAGASVVFYVVFFAIFLVLRVVRFVV